MNADALAFLAGKGFTVEEIVEFARLAERKKDPTNADRQARYRENRKARKVTRYSNGVTPLKERDQNPVPDTISNEIDLKQDRVRAVGFVPPSDIPEIEWEAFEEMRRRIKKPMTNHAREQAVARLRQLAEDGHPPGTVLNHSILNNYQGLFPPKDDRNGRSGTYPVAGNRAEPEHGRTTAAALNVIARIDRAAASGGEAPASQFG